jgi:transposase
MNKTKLQPYLSEEEIERRYRKANEGVERSQWQIIWLLAQGKSTVEVEQATGYSLTWIRTIARRYNAQGPQGIGDRRHRNPGKTGLLSQAQHRALEKAVEAGSTRHENWNGKRVAQWMSEQLGHPVHVQRGYEWLAKYQQTPQVPRPYHQEADAEDQKVFKKSSPSL